MSTPTVENDIDLEEVARFLQSDRKDTATLQRLREQADRFRKKMGEKYGKRNVAVDLVHEAREHR